MGGAGWIGSRVVDELKRLGAKVEVSDTRRNRPVASFFGVAPGDPDQSFDVVVYMAAPTVPDAEESEWVSRDLQSLMLAMGLATKGFVYASSVWVYSSARLAMAGPSERLALPDDRYTAMKLAGEALVHTAPLRTVILRYGLGYGPDQASYMPLPKIVRDVKSYKPFEVFGAADDVRHLCHVDDMADAAVRGVRCVLGLSKAERIVADVVGPAVTLLDMVRIVSSELGMSGLQRATFVRPVEGDICRTEFSTSSAELGWTNGEEIEAGIRAYVRSEK